jgi:hypothetical protein
VPAGFYTGGSWKRASFFCFLKLFPTHDKTIFSIGGLQKTVNLLGYGAQTRQFSRQERRNDMKRKMSLLLGLCLLLAAASSSFASGAGSSVSAAMSVVTDEPSKMPVLMPFRVWVYPTQNNGIMTAGHYEYFHMQIMGNGSDLPLAVPEQQAVEPIIALPQGEPAIPTN